MKSKVTDKFIADMELHGYAKRTKQSYLRVVRQLENFWSRPSEELSEEEVRGSTFSTARMSWGGDLPLCV